MGDTSGYLALGDSNRMTNRLAVDTKILRGWDQKLFFGQGEGLGPLDHYDLQSPVVTNKLFDKKLYLRLSFWTQPSPSRESGKQGNLIDISLQTYEGRSCTRPFCWQF